MTKTFDPEKEAGPWKVISSGGGFSLFRIAIGDESIRHAEEFVIPANPPAQKVAPPSPPTIAVSRRGPRLMRDQDRYALSSSRIGCRKATKLVSMYLRSGASPSGYACHPRPARVRCNRLGHPEKYVEWNSRQRSG